MINKLTQIGQPLPATFGGKAFLSPSRSYHNTTASGGGRLFNTVLFNKLIFTNGAN